MRFTSSQTSFKAGRLSPKLYNRVDTTQYRDGASELSGCRPMIEGGVERIKGFRKINDLFLGTDFTGNVKRPFSFVMYGETINGFFVSIGAAVRLYILKTNYTAVIQNSGVNYVQLIQTGPTTYDLQEFDWAIIDNSIVITHYRGDMVPFVISFEETLTSFTVALFADGVCIPIGALNANYGTGGIFPFFNKLTTGNPYLYAMNDLGEKEIFVTISAFTIGTLSIDVTSLDAATTAILQKTPILYLENIGKKDFGDTFVRSVIGAAFYFNIGSVAGGAKFQTSPTDIWLPGPTDTMNLLGITATNVWAYSAWYEGNWPKTVTSHEGRLVFGGTPDKPLALFGSKVGNYKNFSHIKRPYSGSEFLAYQAAGPTIGTDPFAFTLANKEDSFITFLRSSGNLVIGTDRKEYVASGGDTLFSALSVAIKPQTAIGSKPVTTASNGNSTFFLSRQGKTLHQFKHNDSNGSFTSTELSLLFGDLIDNNAIKKVEWCPHINTLLILMESTDLYGIVINDQAQVAAFYKTGLSSVRDMSYVYDINSIGTERKGPHIILSHLTYGLLAYEQTYFEMGRYSSDVNNGDVLQNAFLFRSASVAMRRQSTTSFAWGGTTVTGVGLDGVPIPLAMFPIGTEVTITIGTDRTALEEIVITIPATPLGGIAGYHVHTRSDFSDNSLFLIGLPAIEMSLATMPIEAGQQWGTSQMGIKNIDTIGVRFYRSYSVEVSAGEGTWEEVVCATVDGDSADARKEVKFSSSPKYDQIVYLRNTKTEPCTIIGLNMRGVSNDG